MLSDALMSKPIKQEEILTIGAYMLDTKIIGNYEIKLNSTKNPQGLGPTVLNQLEKANQVFQISNLGSKVCSFYVSVEGKTEFLKEMGSIFNGGLIMTGLMSVPVTVINAYKAVKAVFSEACEIPGAYIRRGIVALRQVTTSISTVGYSVGPILKACEKTTETAGNVFTIAKGAKLVSDSCAVVESSQDFWISRNLTSEAEMCDSITPEVKEALVDTYRMNFLKLTKSISSIASFALGLSAVSGSLAAYPVFAVGVASISLIGAVLGMVSNIYATQMKHKQIDFFSPDSVGYISAENIGSQQKQVAHIQQENMTTNLIASA